MMRYRMNLVKSMRTAEKRSVNHRASLALLLLVCFSLLALSALNFVARVMEIQRVIDREKQALRGLQAEYQNYQATTSTVDKEDVELLNSLLSQRIYWTRILDAIARHLPEGYASGTSYWVTRFGYRGTTFDVQGYGYITEQQEQLLALDEYLNKLRADPNYSEVFGVTYLKAAVRRDETEAERDGGGRDGIVRERINFEYASQRRGAAR